MSAAVDDALEASELARSLAGTPFGRRLEIVDDVSSTIDAVRGLADAGADEGATVIAESQSAGRGSHGHLWISPRGGGLYLSTLLRPPLKPEQAGALTLAAGLSACEAVREAFGVPAMLKDPNDLLVATADGLRKLGGVLVDTAVQGERLRHAIVSLGLNVADRADDLPEALRGTATSLEAVAGQACRRHDVAVEFLRRLWDLRLELDLVGATAWSLALARRRRPLTVEAPDYAPPVLPGESR